MTEDMNTTQDVEKKYMVMMGITLFGRDYYEVVAASEEEAIAKVENGELDSFLSKIDSSEFSGEVEITER